MSKYPGVRGRAPGVLRQLARPPQQVWTGALIGVGFGAASFGIGTDGVGFDWGMRF